MFNGLFLLFTVFVGVTIHLATKAYYLRLLNEQRKANRLLRAQLFEAERQLNV
jgi:hypothetical protein